METTATEAKTGDFARDRTAYRNSPQMLIHPLFD
jgi:hypothetical protein